MLSPDHARTENEMNQRIALVAAASLVGCAKRSGLASEAGRIRLRMTEAEVQAILGAPSGSMLAGPNQELQDLTYQSGNDVVHVLFMTASDYVGVAAVNLNGKQILSNSK